MPSNYKAELPLFEFNCAPAKRARVGSDQLTDQFYSGGMPNKACLAYILDTKEEEDEQEGERSSAVRIEVESKTSGARRPPCNVEGCPSGAVGNGRCIRHGGGRRCAIDKCPHGARKSGLCWKHGTSLTWIPSCRGLYVSTNVLCVGGSLRCKIPGCTNGRKSHGVCWKHGGGKNG